MFGSFIAAAARLAQHRHVSGDLGRHLGRHPGNLRRPIGLGIVRHQDWRIAFGRQTENGETKRMTFRRAGRRRLRRCSIRPSNECIIGHARVERLWTGARWSEGPTWFAAGRYLVWSDIPNNRLMRYDDTDGNGVRVPATVEQRQWRLLRSARPPGFLRALSRAACNADGASTARSPWSRTRWRGKRLNSPNDVVVKRDGSIWFTDPSYGIMMDYEGERAESDIGACHVYRVDPNTGAVNAVATDFIKPNGLAFSPDETELFISDTGGTHMANGPRHIRRFTVSSDGARLSGRRGAGGVRGGRLRRVPR